MGNTQGSPIDLQPMQKYAEMTVKHVLMLKDRLELLADADLTISKESFVLAMKTKEQETDRIFQLFDLSSVGKIETLEFICALSLLSHANLRQKCDLIFALYDFDKNQTMTTSELIILIKTVLTTINAISSKGECTIQEAAGYAKVILERYDTNGDASISKDEFYSFVSKDPSILRMLISYGLISMQDLRFNFGEPAQIPEADSDLENEVYKSKNARTSNEEKIILGIEQSAGGFSKENLPWMHTIGTKQMEPDPSDASPPNANLEIAHVYGFRCFDTRNNLKYSMDGELVYHQGAIGIQLDSKSNQQRFFMEHTDDITCLDVNDQLAVTGQMGIKPTIFVWDLNTMETKAVFTGVLSVGVSNITISNDGRKLAAVGMDSEQCVVVYDIDKATQSRINGKRDESLMASGKGPSVEIFDIKFDKTDKQIIIACMGEVNFITFDNNLLKTIRGVWESKYCPIQAILSIGLLDNAVAVGSFKGHLLLWRGSRTTLAVEAHKGPIQAIYTQRITTGIITGGKDGQICFWDHNLKLRIRVDLNKLVQLNNMKITALCQSHDGMKIAVGTRGGQVVEIVDNTHAQIIVQGHFNGVLRALCCHPNKEIFYTAGDDQMLMSWSLQDKKLLKSIKLDYQSKCLDVVDKYLAAGCSNGAILILDPLTLIIQMEFKDRDSEITCIKFLPEFDYLVVYNTPPYNEFFFYQIRSKFKKAATVTGKNGSCMTIDYSMSKRLQLALHSQELYYLYLDTMQISPTWLDEEWLSCNSIYGWEVQGIWADKTDGKEINSVDKAKTCNVLVVADDYGSIKLFRYPAYCEGQSYNRYTGHSGHVSSVRFTYQDQYVVSLGGSEKSIVQWKFTLEQNVNEEAPKKLQTKQQPESEEEEQQVQQQSTHKPYLENMKFEQPDEQLEVPQQYLNLKYVFGMRTTYQDKPMYNLLKYSLGNKLVYPAGGLVIVQDTKMEAAQPFRKQGYYYNHTQEVISIAMHPKGNIVASGTSVSEIHIWEVETRACLVVIQDFHKQGIIKMKFSPDGTQLLTIGMDADYSLAIYDWAANRLLCTSKIDKKPIEDICYVGNGTFATAGDFLRIWQQKGRNLTFDQFSGKQSSVTHAFGSELVSGTYQGELILWKDKNTQKMLAHIGKINILLGVKQNLYSAGEDGKIILWHFQQNQLQQAQLLMDQGIPIYSLDARNEILAYINQSNELSELITAGQVRSNNLIKCHSQEVYGVATNKNKFVTCGGDRSLKMWESKNKVLQLAVELRYPLRAVDWVNGLIVVGDSRSYITLLNEKLEILSTQASKFTLTKVRSSAYAISDIKFSPDGSRVAFGATGGPSHIEIWYIINQVFDKQTVITIGFTSGLCHLDWSIDGQFIMASSESYELKQVSVIKQRDVQISTDIKWQTWSCQYGQIVQEIYPYKQGEDVTAVQVSKDRSFILTGDKYGTMNIFRCPALTNISRQYYGHMGRIHHIKYLMDESHAVSVGSRCIMIWGIELDQHIRLDIETDKIVQSLGFPQLVIKKVKKVQQEEIQVDEDGEEIDAEELAMRNTIFMKPWMNNIKEPSSYYKDPINQNTPPLVDLEIEHAHGYRGSDCSNNVKFLKNGCILYHTASLGIVMDTITNNQKIFNYHTDDIISMDLHPDGIKVATGEINTAIIYVWDSNTLQALCRFDQLTIGIFTLNFSIQGNYLAAVAMDQQNEIAIFDINTKTDNGGSLLYKYQTSMQKIFEIKWLNELQFYTIGPMHFKLWTLAQRISCYNIPTDVIFLTCAVLDDDLYIGDVNGRLHYYKQNVLQKVVQVHTQPLEAIHLTKDIIVTGSRDQFIHFIETKNIAQEPMLSFKLSDYVKGTFYPQIRSVQYNTTTDLRVILGTFGCEIWELISKEPKLSSMTKFTVAKAVMKGHYAPQSKSELWGLAVDGDFIYTCGDDATMRQWSISQKKQLSLVKTTLDNNYNEIKPDENGILLDSVRGRSIAVSNDFILVGFKDGCIRVYDRDNKQRQYLKIAKEWISDIKFSPNQEVVAFGSHDNSIYLYRFPDMIPLGKPLRKHSDYIKNIDFSLDGSRLISTCGGYDLIYWDTNSGKQMPQGRLTLRDERWLTWTNTLGWPVQGIWKETYNGTEINCVARSNSTFAERAPDNYNILAVGNDFNEILLYRYPCVNRNTEPLRKRGHSSPIAQIKFSADDKYLVTIGGEDMTVIVWKVNKR